MHYNLSTTGLEPNIALNLAHIQRGMIYLQDKGGWTSVDECE